MIIYEKTKRFKKRWQNLLRFKTDILRFRFAAEGLAFGSTFFTQFYFRFIKNVAINTIIKMKADIPEGNYCSFKCYINHSDFLSFAHETERRITEKFPNIRDL